MALGNIFSLSCPADDGPLENISIFDGGVPPEQDDRPRVAECSMPIGIEKEGLGQRAGRGHQYRLHLPSVKHVSPAGPESHHGLNRLAQEVVAIKISAAVHEYAILGIKLPDRIASPVVVNENSLGLVAGPPERHSLLGKLLRLVGILVAGKTDPLHQYKHSHQNDKSPVEKWPEPRGVGTPVSYTHLRAHETRHE